MSLGPGISRRRFLAAAGGLGVFAAIASDSLLAGATAAPRAAAAADPRTAALQALGHDSIRAPGSLPDPSLPPGSDTLPGIDHIVVLMLENHSYDNVLGMLGRGPGQVSRGDGFTLGADGLPSATNPYGDGRTQHAFRMPTTCQLPGTPSQQWTASHVAYDSGRNDGFVRAPIS